MFEGHPVSVFETGPKQTLKERSTTVRCDVNQTNPQKVLVSWNMFAIGFEDCAQNRTLYETL
jgi:hypothetical protein